MVCGSIYYNLKSNNSQRRLKTIYFLEILIKNCEISFHENLFTHHFCRTLLKILAKRRKKRFLIFNSLITSKKNRQNEIENRLLFFIQLWFDTFMIYYKNFKNIIDVYHKLRKEGVIFPLRNSRHQNFIKFKGQKSPIFESIENGLIYEEPNKLLCQKSYTVEELDSKNFSLYNSCTEFIRNNSNSKNPYQDDFFLNRNKNLRYEEKKKNRDIKAFKIFDEKEMKNLLDLVEGICEEKKEMEKIDGFLKR